MKKFLILLKKFSFKKIILLLLLLSVYVFINAYSYVSKVSSNLQSSVFRLHVIANSDSIEDQNLKYKVRDNLIEYMNSICSNSSSKEETMQIVNDNISNFTDIVNKTVQENGFSYSASLEIGNFEFPTKTYADISFPAGFYDGIKIKLGKSEGQNWWCVLYPSLCFVDVTSGIVPDDSKEELQETLSEEEYRIISDTSNSTINFKFKLIEFFAKNKLLTAKH